MSDNYKLSIVEDVNLKHKISVIMPVYNSEKYLVQSINSILKQTYHNFEFIIIYDGSTDNSLSIINSYKDNRIKVISNEVNIGISESLNIGINHIILQGWIVMILVY